MAVVVVFWSAPLLSTLRIRVQIPRLINFSALDSEKTKINEKEAWVGPLKRNLQVITRVISKLYVLQNPADKLLLLGPKMWNRFDKSPCKPNVIMSPFKSAILSSTSTASYLQDSSARFSIGEAKVLYRGPTWCARQMRSRSCRLRNLETTSAPKVKETPRSFSPQPWTSLSGSDQRRSHRRPGKENKSSFNR